MKKMILILTMASSFIACRNSGERTAGVQNENSPGAQIIGTAQPVQPVQPVVVKKEVRYVNTPQQPAPVQKKKGWSKAAKGAAIGAGVGAVTGAVVSKKKVKGAVIGGVIGAGAGYVIGRNEDKKDGRVKK